MIDRSLRLRVGEVQRIPDLASLKDFLGQPVFINFVTESMIKSLLTPGHRGVEGITFREDYRPGSLLVGQLFKIASYWVRGIVLNMDKRGEHYILSNRYKIEPLPEKTGMIALLENSFPVQDPQFIKDRAKHEEFLRRICDLSGGRLEY